MAERAPQVFLMVVNDADDRVAAGFLDEQRVPWTSEPLGESGFAGWLQYLLFHSTPADLAVAVVPLFAVRDWGEEQLAVARQLAEAVLCRRMLLVDVRGASATDEDKATLSSLGNWMQYESRDELLALLKAATAIFANTAPPPTAPPPPRVIAAGVGRSGIADVAAEVDSLGFEPYVNAVAAFLAHEQTAVPLTMSIEGPWGTGKSSFMRQLEKRLAASFRTIRFNAWRHEKAEELWAAFALHFVHEIKPKNRWKRWRADSTLAWRRFDFGAGWPDLVRIAFWFLALATATITLGTMAWSLGPNALNAIVAGKQTLAEILGGWFGVGGWFLACGALTTIWQKFFAKVTSPLEIDLRKYLKRPDYEGKLAFIERFQADLRDVIDVYLRDSGRVFVFIDDLDRCELPQAAELMRAINLMLSDSGPIVFVIGMDREKVAAALAVKHEKLLPFLSTDAPRGPAHPEPSDSLRGIFFGYEFLEKFIQIPFAVPEPSELNVESFLSSLATPKPAAGTPRAAQTSAPAPAPAARAAEPAPQAAAKLHEFVRPLDDESTHLLEIARKIAPALGNNPRRVKQFVNMFRLRVVIAFATDLFVAPEDTPPEKQITLEKIAKFIAIELRWPLLIAQAELERELLARLEYIAAGGRDPESSFRADYWSNRRELMTLLSIGVDDPDWQLGEIELTRLTNVSVKKPRPVKEEELPPVKKEPPLVKAEPRVERDLLADVTPIATMRSDVEATEAEPSRFISPADYEEHMKQEAFNATLDPKGPLYPSIHDDDDEPPVA